jgi:hypothetical protein
MLRPRILQICIAHKHPAHVKGALASDLALCLQVQPAFQSMVATLYAEAGR